MVVHAPVALPYDILSARASSYSLALFCTIIDIVSLYTDLIHVPAIIYAQTNPIIYITAIETATNHQNNSDRKPNSSNQIFVSV